MKKYLFGALALPLLFACSSEDFDEKVISNDQFAGIAKVDATFSINEGPQTRFDAGDGSWVPEEGDKWGFAWLGDGTIIDPTDATNGGKAFQNHNLIQTNNIFTPQTSIYVGKYYIYRPYDETTVSPQAINFNSLLEQPLAAGYASTTQAWKNLGKTAINIGDKWTVVTAAGTPDVTDPTFIWNKAGIKQHYEINAALFSNQTGLDLTYVTNNPTLPEDLEISGATDIEHTYAAGTEVGSANLYQVEVTLAGAAKSFTYAPKAEPNAAAHDGKFWADKDGTADVTAAKGFTLTPGAITLANKDGVSTGADGSNGWFWFNSLPVSAGNGAIGTNVTTVLSSTYGVVTVPSTVGACAYVFDQYTAGTGSNEWIKLAAADNEAVTPKTWDLAGAHNTFINQYGNHKGKYALNVDFKTGIMNGMHVKNDADLQQLLKYYKASGKTNEGAVVLNLDGASDTDKSFRLSKISIALIQTLLADGVANVKLQACGTHNAPVKIIVTQDGQAELGLAAATEVPNLKNVFAAATDVYLAANTTWTWNGEFDGDDDTHNDALQIDGNVSSVTNEGTLTVNATNLQLSNPGSTLGNGAGATMNITKVTTVKNDLTNLGTINVGSASNTAPELRAYGVAINNDATALDEYGVINNYGVVGVSAGGGAGSFNNYGLITMMNDDAITLLTSNQVGGNIGAAWSGTNKMGTVELPNGNINALVSVSNATSQGFIKYNWPATTTNYSTPAGNVKFNTIVVSGDITFGANAPEIQYIEFNGTRTQVVNPTANNYLSQLKGVIVNKNKSIIIEKTNKLNCSNGAYLAKGATVYKGGVFTKAGVDFVAADATAANNYFGKWSLDQIVKW